MTVSRKGTTLFEEIAYRLGFERLEERIEWLPNPFVCWGISVFFIDLIILQALKEWHGYQATFYTNPIWVIQPVLVLLAPFVVIYLHNRYESALHMIDYTDRTSNPETFESLTLRKLRIGIYLIAISYSIYQFSVSIGIGTITEVGGIAELLGVIVILPLGYGVIFAEFLATYIELMIVLPRKIKKSDFQINFFDPEELGGLRPVGELMKVTYYFVVFGLISFAIMIYAPAIVDPLTDSPYPDPGLIENLLFTLVWLLAIGTMVYGLAQIHWFMKRRKREELFRLDRESRNLIENQFDMKEFEILDEEAHEDVRQRMEYVRNTQEYPTTFTMWIQILIGLILPKAVQVVLSSV
ncbi:MAG: hypothetical protein V5A34_00020 [Halapricum sp.]